MRYPHLILIIGSFLLLANASFSVNVTWYSQTPADISAFNTFYGGVNITYNITDSDGIDPASPLLYYKTNSTGSDCWTYVNGSVDFCGYQTLAPTSNASELWLWTLYDNEIYPATFNFPERNLELTPHSIRNLATQNDMLKVRLFNVSSTKQYGVFEVMANISSGTSPLRIYYCNSSYVSGNPTVSPYCTNFYNLPSTQQYNHSHSAYSSHMAIPFAVNTSSGMIGNVHVTGTSYFLLRPTFGSSWNVYYITNISRSDTIRITSTNGNSWSNFAGTVDSHLHQYDGSDRLWYYACANDTLGESSCSAERFDYINLTGIPPTAPDVYSPANDTYCGSIEINYTASVSPNGYPITHYNISLLNSDFSFNKTITGNNSNNLSYLWNTSTTDPGNYIIRVEACDDQGQCSFGYSFPFTFTGECNNISVCQEISTNGTYTVTADLTGVGMHDSCIYVTAEDVIVLCEGHSLTGEGSGNGFLMNLTDSVTIRDCVITNYTNAVYGLESTTLTVINVTAEENDDGFNVEDADGVTIRDSKANNNGRGLALGSSKNVLADPSYFCNNAIGILVNLTNDSVIEESIACNNTQYGIYIVDSDNITVSESRTYNNALDFQAENNLGGSVALSLSSLEFDRPAGDRADYSDIYMTDSLASGEDLAINWTANATALPPGYVSFAGKFVDISSSGAPSITSIEWHWTDSEASAGGYNESSLDIFEWDGSNWTEMDATLDTVANTLTLSSFTPSSDYGILGNLSAYLPVNLYGVNVTVNTTHGRFDNGTAQSNPTEGGNITGVAVSSAQLTEKWAAFYGDVVGAIVLRGATGSNVVYHWDWTPINGGVVCVSTNSSLANPLLTGAFGLDIDNAWNFSASADSAASTFNQTNCTVDIGSASVSEAAYADTGAAGGFMTCALKSATIPSKNELLFCSRIISGGTAWDGGTADFELMVPTDDAPGTTESYYFYANLD